LIFLETCRAADHAKTMIKGLLQILALACAAMAAIGMAYAIWHDLNSPLSASIALGALWYDLHPASLQISETIISRYIDPCGLIVALDCTPVLWHPLIASVLGWPAALVGFVVAGILWFFAKPGRGSGRSKRSIGRS